MWVRGHSKSFKLVPLERLDEVSQSNYGSILYHFRDKARYWSNIVIFSYPLYLTPPLGRSSSEYCHLVWCGKTRMVCLPITQW